MDFLELWKNYPVLWHQIPTPKDTAYHAAMAELTKKINRKRNLTITNAGMMLTLSRIRKWFLLHKRTAENSSGTKGQILKREYYENSKREYYEKCSEFLPKHETRSVTCEKCNCFFSTEEQLQEHNVKRHKTYCELCQKEYGSTKLYRKHAFYHMPPRHKCDICGKEYVKVSGFNEHMRAHRNERNYVCELCGKKFVRQKNLRGHTMLRHPSKDNYLKRPPCAICNIDFKDWSALSIHRKKQHLVLEGTIEQLTAQTCKAGVREKRKHTFILDPVTKQRRTVCEICGNTYARHGGLYVHMVKEHGFVRPGERLKAAQQTSASKTVELVDIEMVSEAIKVEKQPNSDQMEDEVSDEAVNDESNLIYEDEDYIDDEYEFILEDLEIMEA